MERQHTENLFRRYKGQLVNVKTISAGIYKGRVGEITNDYDVQQLARSLEAMNLAEADQRLCFVVDEPDALGQIDGLKDALARLRKFGGRCI